MFNNYFILKLLLAPLIIMAGTLVSRRWGGKIGGLMIGLPLTSAPVSIFFTIEQGRSFATRAAVGAILGLIAVSVFCVTYAQVARRFPWYAAAAAGVFLYLASVWAISLINPGIWLTAILVPCVLALALLSLKSFEIKEVPILYPRWDLPLRMFIATFILILITSAANFLGPKWSGLLSPFPIFTFVMVTFSHHQAGPDAAWRFIDGVLTGLFGYIAFFLVVALSLERVNPILVYSLATLAALGVNGTSLARVVWRNRAAHVAGL